MIFKLIFAACLLWLVLSVGKINILKEEITQAKQNTKKMKEEMVSVLGDIAALKNQDLGYEDGSRLVLNSLMLIAKKPINEQEKLIYEFLGENLNEHYKILIKEQIELSQKITATKKMESMLIKKLKKINSSFWLDPLNAGKKWS
tara:strand:+ start:4605 stop:5039 length:435 start_codon:yes stop_codon:yes gene_type:complete